MSVDLPDDDEFSRIPASPRSRAEGSGAGSLPSNGPDLGLQDGEFDQADAITIGRRPLDSSNSAPVTEAESVLLKKARAEQERRYAEALEALVPPPPFWTRWIGSRLLVWIAVLIGIVLTLFCLAQAALLAAQVETLSPFLRYPAYVAACLLLAGFGLAAGKLIVLFVRLRKSPAFQTDALLELARRQRIRAEFTQRAVQHVFESVQGLLREYPLDDRSLTRLKVLGADDEQIARLKRCRSKLVPVRHSPTQWIEEYRTGFLGVLDEIAGNRIWRATLLSGQLTAISPQGTIDALITSSLALELVGDLCRLYNLRFNRLDTVRILGTVMLSAEIASQADDWCDDVAESLTEDLPMAGLEDILGSLLSKLGNGAVNARLVRRIGWRTVRALRPVK